MDYLIVYWEILALTFILAAILLFNVRQEMGSDREVGLFKAFLLTLMIALIIDGFSHAQYREVLQMNPTLVALLYATYMFLISGAMPYLWLLFAELRMGHSLIKNRKVLFLSMIPVLIISAMSFASIFTGWFFIIDEEGAYTRGPLWSLQNVVAYGYFLFTTIHAVITARKEPSPRQRRRYYVLALFIVAPFFGAMLQLFIGGHPFIAPASLIALVFIYINIQNNMINQDSLTGLANRRSVEQYIEELKMKVTERDAFYLYVTDIDEFKKINDTMGHITGDHVLRIVANLLQKVTDEYGGHVGRLGGDEFIAVIEADRIADPDDFEASFTEAAENEAEHQDLPYSIDMSFGYVRCETGNCKTNDLISAADSIMYDNKKKKRQK